MSSNQRNSDFTFADFFPIREGDLCQLTEDANNSYNENIRYGEAPKNHPLYNKVLIATKIVKGEMSYYIQEDSRYSDYPMNLVYFRKII